MVLIGRACRKLALSNILKLLCLSDDSEEYLYIAMNWLNVLMSRIFICRFSVSNIALQCENEKISFTFYWYRITFVQCHSEPGLSEYSLQYSFCIFIFKKKKKKAFFLDPSDIALNLAPPNPNNSPNSLASCVGF